MKYNFDICIDRRNTNSLKWDISANELPMWVADMDFPTAPEITGAIIKRAEHGIFGYNVVPDQWYEAYISHWQRRYNFSIKKEWLIFSTGVVPAISSIVRKLTTPAEKVVIITPVYNIFFNSIINNGRNPLECQLKYENGKYSIDFDDLERKFSDSQTTMMIFCNPHNPVGEIWDRKTLERVGDLCEKYHVIAVSDEIHCDLTDPGKSYIPFASVSENCRKNSITCIAPTKSFNIAGLQTAAVMTSSEFLFNKVNRGLNTDEAAEPNCFAAIAPIAAYNYGEEWLDELREYIYENKQLTAEFIKKEIPQLYLVPSDATYLLWLDCKALGGNAERIAEFVREKTGLFVSEGGQYGKGGEDFLRLNIACPKKRLIEGLERLKNGISEYIKQEGKISI